MASLGAHRLRAVTRAALDGVVVGGSEAALALPARSRARSLTYAAILTAVVVDVTADEYPAMQRAFAGLPDLPQDPRERSARIWTAVATCGWGLAITIVDGPLARVLRRRGHRRPHLLLGVAAGVATAASTAPVWWRRAAQRAADDAAAAAQAPDSWDTALAELLDSTPG